MSGCLGLGGWGEKKWLLMGTAFLYALMKMI